MNKGDLKKYLEEKLHKNEIEAIYHYILKQDKLKKSLYLFLSDTDKRINTNAAWILCQFDSSNNSWFIKNQGDLMEMVMHTPDTTLRRLILTILSKQTIKEENYRIDFFDFCIKRMMKSKETTGIKSLSIKLAYKLCKNLPELKNELKMNLEIMEPDLLTPGMKAIRNQIIKELEATI